MEKRQIGELQVSEFIVTLLLSEIASAPVTSQATPLLYAVVSFLLSELRQMGFSDLSEIEYAVLEANGKLSVFPKDARSPVATSDLSLPVRESGIAHVIVLDGALIARNS